jgi:hypothetical protein
MKLRWRFGIVAGLFLAVFSLYPQGKLLYNRSGEWNGNYAYNDIDEVAYAGYLKALIDGRPRRNDPYTGRDDTPDSPQPESLFSIQFAAVYAVALPAKVLGIDAPWAMTISGAVAIFLTGLAIFWLIGMITGDSLYAMADALIVIAGGALFGGEGAIGEILFDYGFSYPYFPGFRRYLPAMAMPVFFAMAALVWRLVSRQPEAHPRSKIQDQRSAILLIALASLCFGCTVFSYFYIWTTAAAWLGCLGLCWLAARPEGVWRDIKRLAVLALGCGLFLIPYAWMLAHRSRTMDDVQMLVHTRVPDLARVPELISYAVLLLIAALIAIGRLKLRDRGTLFAASLALTPIAVFNQQVVTGQALQPIHYQVFIGNYVAGLAAVVTFGLVWRDLKGRERPVWRTAIAGLALLAVVWGFVECHYTVRVLDDANIVRDKFFPAGRRLAELAQGDPDARHRTVLCLGTIEADELPTLAPQAVLWARHQHLFAGVTWQENKERYYQQLYYEGVTPERLADGMKHHGDFVSIIALFGWGRHTDRLNSDYHPLTFPEIDAEVRLYADYIANFNPSNPGVVPLDYLIARTDESYAENLDKWYTRDAGETFGAYTLYKLTRR